MRIKGSSDEVISVDSPNLQVKPIPHTVEVIVGESWDKNNTFKTWLPRGSGRLPHVWPNYVSQYY